MWLITILMVLILNILFYLWFVIDKRKYKDIEKIPGPPVKPLLGNALEFGTSIVDLFSNCQRLIREYGPFVRIWQGPFRLNIFVTDPDIVEFFLSSNKHIKKSVSYDYLAPWLGQGLITSTGDSWRKHRKMLTPAFHFKILEQFSDTFHETGKILIRKLKQDVGKPVDIFSYVSPYALDILCDSSMRIDMQAQSKSQNSYIKATETIMDIFIRRFYSALLSWDFYFKLTSVYREQQKCANILQTFTRGVIQQRKQEKIDEHNIAIDDFGIKQKKAFIDILLDSNELSDEEVMEEVNTILFAGHDTVTASLGFILFELAKHENVQRNLLDELYEIVGEDRDKEITLRHLQEMNYLDRVVKEMMRLYPPIVFFERQLQEDVIINEIIIPNGTTISFHPYSQHRNEKYFPDPDKFDPDRFLPDNAMNRHPFAYIPFSAGPRNCIGLKYALASIKTTILNIIRNFKLYPVQPTHEPVLGNAAALRSINGLPIIFKFKE